MIRPHLLPSMLLLSALAACSRDEPPTAAPAQDPDAATEAAPLAAITGPAQMVYEEPIVGGARMVAGNDILTNLGNSKDHTILMEAIREAGLTEILKGSGPFTLFAPTDAAFRRMPGGYEDLMKEENRQRLITVLTYHLVPERLDADILSNRVMAGNGVAQLATVQGGMIKATVGDGAAILVDAQGGVAKLTVPNVLQSNGIVQVIDKVLIP